MNPAYEALLESHKYIEILVGYLDSEDEVCHMAACDVLADLAIEPGKLNKMIAVKGQGHISARVKVILAQQGTQISGNSNDTAGECRLHRILQAYIGQIRL